MAFACAAGHHPARLGSIAGAACPASDSDDVLCEQVIGRALRRQSIAANRWMMSSLVPGQRPSFADEWMPAFEKLQVWLLDPAALADDDFEPPSRGTIRLVIDVARRCCGKLRAPTRVMPNGERGIVLEWVMGETRRTWEIDAEHRCEISVYKDGHRSGRRCIDASSLSSS